MMRKLRALLFVILSFLLVTGWTTSVFAEAKAAESTAAKQYKVYVIDKADLLTPEEEQKLATEMQELTQYGNMVFLTIKLKTRQYEKFSQDVYYKLCGNEPGVIFQIDMGNRKLTLSSSTAMDDVLRSERDTIVDNIYRMATNKQYYACASECFREIKAVLHNEEIAHDMKYITNGIFALILGLIINFIAVFATTRKKVSKKDLFTGMSMLGPLTVKNIAEGKQEKVYSPKSKGSGGGFSGGGGGRSSGGGFSGGSSSHGF